MSDVINGVPRELLERLFDAFDNDASNPDGPLDELRALLTAQPQASAAQSAPAGEREGFEARYSVPDGISWSGASYGPVGRQHQLSPAVFVGLCGKAARLDAQLEAFQAGAAWQRTQSAGVPDGWRLVPVEPTPAMLRAGVHQAVGALPIYRAMLSAAPAQPAARDHGEVQRLREALGDAAQSLETISSGAGLDEFMKDASDVRCYARSRAGVARAALAASTGQEVKP